MKRKFFSCLMFSALIGAGMISVTSCADYDEDMKALTQIVDQNTTVTTALQSKVDGMQAQIKALQDALAGMKSCNCGDVDAKIANQINKALAGLNYTTPEQVADAINKALAGINTGLTAEEVQALIDAYHTAHPNCSSDDIEALIKKYLTENPGLSESDVNKLVEAYIAAHPQSSLTEADVKSIVETYINQLQHFTKEQIEGMINTAITQALAGYVQSSDAYTKSQVEALIADAVKSINPGLSKEEVQALIDAAVKNVKSGLSESEVNKLIEAALKNVKSGLTAEEVQALIDAAKCNCPALTSDDVTTIATSVIEKYMQEHPYTLDAAAVENICNSVIANSQVINNLQGAIETLQGTVEQIQSDLEGLKDNVYTKSEVENLINSLIAQANGSLTADQQTIVSQLIQQAISEYNAAHPDCNCQYDADAFQTLAEAVSNSATKAELDAIKDLIPDAANLDNYVTISQLTQDINTINGAISAADSKAQQALEKANANGIAVEGLQTAVSELQNLYLALSDKLNDTAHKAEVALNRSLSNYFEIETLKELYSQLNSSDVEINGRIDELETKMEELATKDELEEQINAVKDLIEEAKTAANTAAGQALENAKAYTDGKINAVNIKIGELEDAYKAADELLQGQIDTINGKLDEIDGTLTSLQQQIDAATGRLDKVENALANLITGVELQGSVNPAFGYFALPVGVSSNVLIAYYGENDHETYFPSIDDMDLVYSDPSNWITEEDANRIGMPTDFHKNGHSTLVNEEGNAGKLYLTLNPTSVDFTGTTLKLVNSLGEESPVTLSAVKKSNAKLTFGSSRATSTGFYEAAGTIDASKISSARVATDRLTEALKDVAKNKFNANLSDLSQAIYKQFNGTLDAYAVQASWTDQLGEHTVTSQYGIAATAIKPLSYDFLYGKNFKLPTITPLSDYDFDLKKIVDPKKFNFTVPTVNANFDFTVDFSDIYLGADGSVWSDITVTVPNEDYIKEPVKIIDATGHYDGGTIYGYNKKTAEHIAVILKDRCNAWSSQFNKEFTEKFKTTMEDLQGQINDAVADVGGQLEGSITDVLDRVQDKLNSALNIGDKFINQLNKFIEKFNDKVLAEGNVNLRLQSQLFFTDKNGYLRTLSTAKGIPTIITGDGEAIELNLTSFTGEILAPSYKKFVAVTNVYKDGEDADSNESLMAALKKANSTKYFNEVFTGDRYSVAFTPDTSVKGATYEIVYSSLDFFGRISQRKYYIHVK